MLAPDLKILLEHITPYDVTEKEKIKEIHDLIFEITDTQPSESYFFNTILHSEIANACRDEKKRLQENLKNIDEMYNGKLKAHFIIKKLQQEKQNNPKLVEEILSKEDINGNTPLSLALMTRNYDISIELLKLRANPNVIIDNVDDLTPLHVAYIMENAKLIKILKKYGAQADAKNKNGKIPSDYIQDFNQSLRKKYVDKIFTSVNLFFGKHYKEEEKGTLEEYKPIQERFFEAIKKADKDMVKEILPYIDIDKQDNLGRTALHFAIMRPSLLNKDNLDIKDRTDILSYLLSCNPKLNISNNNGNTINDLLERDSKSSNFFDKEFAKMCKKPIQERFLGKIF